MTQKNTRIDAQAITEASPAAGDTPSTLILIPKPDSSPSPVKGTMRLQFPKITILELLQKRQTPTADNKWYLDPKATLMSVQNIQSWPPAAAVGAPPAPDAPQNFSIAAYNCFFFQPLEGEKLDGGTIKGKLIKSGLDEHAASTQKYDADLAAGKIFKVEDVEFTANFSALTDLSPESTQKIITGLVADPQSSSPSPPSAFSKSFESFMSPDSNSIVKSFESTGGKGLAGFIDSMNFDWYNGVTWDVDAGRKAPKMCKVTINFTPIHDISPGLDSNGQNRAPIYRLGPYQAQK